MPHIEKRPAGATEQTYVPATIPFEQLELYPPEGKTKRDIHN